MFRFLRIQVVHPCRAKCVWCATHKKNHLFKSMVKSGLAGQIHRFYIETIKRLNPEEVFLSGGEPMLSPDIAELLSEIAPHVKLINLFTSYQWAVSERKKMPFDQLPLDKIVFNHTPIYFEPGNWEKLTQGFPFDVYLDNVRYLARLPARKRFKFIINHEHFADEIRRFQELVTPDESFHLSLKVINDQGNGLMVDRMAQTRELINRRVRELDTLVDGAGWGRVKRAEGSLEQMAHLLEDGSVERCAFRSRPVELRFALDPKVRKGRPVLRYRYCPYFPPSFGHRFHIGSDDPELLELNYFKGTYRNKCDDCRFMKYYAGRPTCTAPAPDPQPTTASSGPAALAAWRRG